VVAPVIGPSDGPGPEPGATPEVRPEGAPLTWIEARRRVVDGSSVAVPLSEVLR
jgi:hypothetical protein